MSRSKNAFLRAYDFGESPSGCPTWLERFAQEQAAKEESELKKEAAEARTIVDYGRNRGQRPSGPSIYDQMHAIMNGGRPARAGSVDEVVQQYQERTGLKNYLKQTSAQSKLASIASQIKAVAQPVDEEELELEEVDPGEFGLDIPIAGEEEMSLEGGDEPLVSEDVPTDEEPIEAQVDIPLEELTMQMGERLQGAEPTTIKTSPEEMLGKV